MRYDTTAIRTYAIEKHGDQRYGEHPYVHHLDMVYEESLSHGLTPIVSVASFLHDVIEDTDVTYDDLVKEFGCTDLADLVQRVTDEPGANRKERKAATYPKIKESEDAIALKLCDRISNVRSCIEDKNEGLLEMYKNEHHEFSEKLRTADVHVSLWEELDRVIKG